MADAEAVQLRDARVAQPLFFGHGGHVGVRPPLGVDVEDKPVFLLMRGR